MQDVATRLQDLEQENAQLRDTLKEMEDYQKAEALGVSARIAHQPASSNPYNGDSQALLAMHWDCGWSNENNWQVARNVVRAAVAYTGGTSKEPKQLEYLEEQLRTAVGCFQALHATTKVPTTQPKQGTG